MTKKDIKDEIEKAITTSINDPLVNVKEKLKDIEKIGEKFKQGETPPYSEKAEQLAQQYVERNFRSNASIIDITGKNLIGSLDLHRFPLLVKLRVNDNQITKLDVEDLKYLKEIEINNNKLSNLHCRNNPLLEVLEVDNNNFLSLPFWAIGNLKVLKVANNNLKKTDLSVLKNFSNLVTLNLGNNDKGRIEQGLYNRWVGNLSELKNLKDLTHLQIDNTDIEGDLKDLPPKISPQKLYHYFIIHNDLRKGAKVNQLREQLIPYNFDLIDYQRKQKKSTYASQKEVNELREQIKALTQQLAEAGNNEELAQEISEWKEKEKQWIKKKKDLEQELTNAQQDLVFVNQEFDKKEKEWEKKEVDYKEVIKNYKVKEGEWEKDSLDLATLQEEKEQWKVEKKTLLKDKKLLEQQLKEWDDIFPNLGANEIFNDWDNCVTNHNNLVGELEKWTSEFPNATAEQIKQKITKLEQELATKPIPTGNEQELKSQIEQLKVILAKRSHSHSTASASGKETKICEICLKSKNDNFTYSRIVSPEFDRFKVYCICSYCKKIVRFPSQEVNMADYGY